MKLVSIICEYKKWLKSVLMSIQLVMLIGLLSCTTETEIHQDNTNKLLANGQILKVEKSSTFATTKGILGQHTYDTSHSYRYKVVLTQLVHNSSKSIE